MPKRKGRKRYRVHTKEEIWCSICKTNSVISSSDVLEIICGDCFACMIYWEELQEKKGKVNYVKGWNLKKKYKAPDGKVYSFGEEITGEKDANDTKKSRGKTKSVSKAVPRTSGSVLSKKNKTVSKKRRKKS